MNWQSIKNRLSRVWTTIRAENVCQTTSTEFVPSIGDYFAYDELIYYYMTHDRSRNAIYKAAINAVVKDKIVLDIGTGQDVILSRFCVAAGAKRIYAIERSKRAYLAAQALVKELGLTDKIHLMLGDSTEVELPEPVDVCVSELLGTIAGSEGVAVILNNARRFLKPDGRMIPERSLTKIAAVALPDELLHRFGFSQSAMRYVDRIFQAAGHPFDLRVCIRRFPPQCILSNIETFEDLNFNGFVEPEFQHEIQFTIQQSAKLNGFLLWLELITLEPHKIDVLKEDGNWQPVYFPVFYPGVEVSAGDRLQVTCRATLSDNGISPDYQLVGKLLKQSGETIEFQYDSLQHREGFRKTPFYQDFFTTTGARVLEARSQQSMTDRLRRYRHVARKAMLQLRQQG
ncbi:methyltransferase domain-containing protein [Oscillatoria sp. FACHB-1407]|uniref:methyltransferase domain-containing protein n=1 Tax=Oscillatoria sp. FACHB-1407 TaxID=2692847 RepID=UPI001685BBC8|nr:methyltransferase domain-containing protein [Oscillatoria sp. FACHB-1407]MBD2461956.1 methyltransferase domain-containing protein [Oscillatoria sp. FACHB-1407]